MATNYEVPPQYPDRLHIQTISYCNASCVFCAYPNVKQSLSHGIMEDAVYTKIIDEAALYGPKRVALLLMNEPLLDRKLPERIAYAKKKLGDTSEVTITSNGSILTPKVIDRLADSGLDRIKISIQGMTPETYQDIMGLDFQRTMDGVNRLIDTLNARKLRKPKVVLSMVNIGLNEEELKQFRAFWKKKGVKATFVVFENKGGNIAESDMLHPYGLKPFKRCYRFNRCAYIVYNGDVILCCADWTRSVVLGNVKEQSLQQIWHGAKLNEIRENFIHGRREQLPGICQNCKRTKRASRSHSGFTSIYHKCLHYFRKQVTRPTV